MTKVWQSYQEFLDQVVAFKATIEQAKATEPANDRTWYAYDTLANFWTLESLFEQLPPSRLELLKQGHVADIGCADGDLGFFLASQGLRVDLIDWPMTNWNGLKGARALQERLNPADLTIHEVDLDSQFKLPQSQYDLVFFLGILYHVKNPYFILERLSERARFCMLSTRIARFTQDMSVELEKAPVAYLLEPEECNNDPTNFWIFSEFGLTRLLNRCGWNIEASVRVGDTEHSNPGEPDRDERIFLALKSRHFIE